MYKVNREMTKKQNKVMMMSSKWMVYQSHVCKQSTVESWPSDILIQQNMKLNRNEHMQVVMQNLNNVQHHTMSYFCVIASYFCVHG